MKIEMEKSFCFRPFMPPQKLCQVLSSKVVHHSRGNEDVARVLGGKRISVYELARQAFRLCQPVGFRNQSRVEIDAHQFNVVFRRLHPGRKPSRRVTNSAPDIDNPQRFAEAVVSDRCDQRFQNLPNAVPVIKPLRRRCISQCTVSSNASISRSSSHPSFSGSARTARSAF